MENPFFAPWTAAFGAPPLDFVRQEHFLPAYDRALAEHRDEIAAIANDQALPNFTNVIAALELSGAALRRIEAVFSNLALSETNPALQATELEMAPRLARHWNTIHLNPALFARIAAVYATRDTLALSEEQLRVLERYYLDFIRSGAKLDSAARLKFAAAGERLASLSTQFSQNVLADEQAFLLPLEAVQMVGVPESVKDAAARTAKERGIAAPYALTLWRSVVEPFLTFAQDRSAREQLFRAFLARGNANSPIIAEIVALRNERAQLLGFESYAAYKIADSMAGTPAKARALLDAVWIPARARALTEREALSALIAEEGGNFQLAPWDWRYYAEKSRARLYAFDDSELRPYFALDRMIEAAFFTAGKLFGLSFRQRGDLPVYHPDVRVWEVAREDQVIGLFYGDYFARESKQGGAWMSSLRDQSALNGEVLPIILNNCNFANADPCLLSFDDARTLFHEFGHALHGLLSRVTFPRLSGTQVAQDFVEMPSQLYEHWLEEPQVLSRFAIHYKTGAPIPRALLDKLIAARHFNQGFATVEYIASAFIDLAIHEGGAGVDPVAVEEGTLVHIGMPAEIAPRHGARHFGHIFSGENYSAGYYSYLWAEVLDADGFQAFKELGDPFDVNTARRLHNFIYSAGGTRDFAAAYRAFRGRDPNIAALLEGRGLSS